MHILKNGKLDTDSPLSKMISRFDPDVLAFNEIKCSEEHSTQFEIDEFSSYHKIWNFSTAKKGYSGVSVWSKIEPLSVCKDIETLPEGDTEGRSITVEFEDFFLLATYVPNSGRSLERAIYREKVWDKAILEYIQNLEIKKPVTWVGDLNVAICPIDVYAVPLVPTPGFLQGERHNFNLFLKHGLVDVWRRRNPERRTYTWWSYQTRARQHNRGWRIDYSLVSENLVERVTDCQILDSVFGSDHCPILIELST
jgi:exodeoxyribonuclease-3